MEYKKNQKSFLEKVFKYFVEYQNLKIITVSTYVVPSLQAPYF